MKTLDYNNRNGRKSKFLFNAPRHLKRNLFWTAWGLLDILPREGEAKLNLLSICLFY